MASTSALLICLKIFYNTLKVFLGVFLLKIGEILGVGILATGLLFSGCFDKDIESPSPSVQVTNEKFPQFATSNLTGENVSDNIFAQKKITVVNIWGTFCPPCIAEMPELGEWARNMPEDAQIIGIVCDVENPNDLQTIEAANMILSEANANFVNLVPNESLVQYLQTVEAVPTTFFVDSNGNFIAEPVIGADVESYKRRVEEYLK